MTTKELESTINRYIPIKSSWYLEQIIVAILKFKRSAQEQIDYADLEMRLVRHAKRSFKLAVTQFFVRLRDNYSFEVTETRKEILGKTKIVRDSRLTKRRKKQKKIGAISTRKSSSWTRIRPAKGERPKIFIPGLGITESEEDILHRK